MANNQRFSTPIGTAVYPRLKTPDTKFDDNGIYKADVSIPKDEAAPLMKTLGDLFKAHTGKAPKASENTMWYLETDEEGEETGNVVFKIRVKNRINKNGELWDRRPKQFDAALKPIDVNPWGGSRYSVNFEFYPWDAGGKRGCSLQPLGVQIIELVTGDGPSGASMGFTAQEGFTAEPSGFEDEDDKPPAVQDEYDTSSDTGEDDASDY